MYLDIDPYTGRPVLAAAADDDLLDPTDTAPPRRPRPQHRRRLLPQDGLTAVVVLTLVVLAAIAVVGLLLGLLADQWGLLRGPGMTCALFLLMLIAVRSLVHRQRRRRSNLRG